MKEPFDEARVAKSRDPLDAPDQGFDWDALYKRLGEDLRDGKVDERLEDLLIRLLQLLVPEFRNRIQPDSVGLRLIALAWVLNPGYFDGAPSLRELARRCGVSAVALARHTGRYSRLMQWRNRGQKHAWNWRKRLERSDLQGIQGAEGGVNG